jgi:transcriptional regulator with XRE-family HTH domain
MSFGEKIRKKRNEKNMTQQTVAEKIGVSRQAISNWERDVKKPELQKLIELLNLLDVSPDELLKDELTKSKETEENATEGNSALKIAPALQIFAEALKNVASDMYITDEEDNK